jgi:hypothetical protein
MSYEEEDTCHMRRRIHVIGFVSRRQASSLRDGSRCKAPNKRRMTSRLASEKGVSRTSPSMPKVEA